MAKTKEEKALSMQEEKIAKEVIEVATNPVAESNTDSTPDSVPTVETKKSTKDSKEPKAQKASKPAATSGPTYDELLAIVQQLAGEVQSLKASGAQVNTQTNTATPVDTTTNRILEMLANRKSDREVVIVHNTELLGGLSTHIELTGLTIDFHTLGEQRLLSWQQFEECVSKYRSFFEREIILLSEDEAELSARYSIPCVKRAGKAILTHDDIVKLPTLDARKLEDFINTLTDADRDFVFGYWLGKCYEKASGFYDRYKIEMLNNLSSKHVFDNLLTLMNGDFRNEREKQ